MEGHVQCYVLGAEMHSQPMKFQRVLVGVYVADQQVCYVTERQVRDVTYQQICCVTDRQIYYVTDQPIWAVMSPQLTIVQRANHAHLARGSLYYHHEQHHYCH